MDLKLGLVESHWYGLVTNGSSHEDDKYLLVLIRNVGHDPRLIEISLLYTQSINSCSTTTKIFEVCDTVLKDLSLDWRSDLIYLRKHKRDGWST